MVKITHYTLQHSHYAISFILLLPILLLPILLLPILLLPILLLPILLLPILLSPILLLPILLLTILLLSILLLPILSFTNSYYTWQLVPEYYKATDFPLIWETDFTTVQKQTQL